MFDVFRWISSFPRFGMTPPAQLVEQVERQSSGKDGDAADQVDSHAHQVFKKFGMRPGLERMQAILNRLGNPERSLRFVHIAGTNGKGSTAAFLASMFRAAGLKTGLYTSPYLTEFQERMSVNEVQVSTEQLTRYAEILKPIVDDCMSGPAGPPTEFEVVTVLAILYFLELEVDVVVWETGLGGRLDSTNVVFPIASIITNIGLEHTEILGDTVELIAKEKAGIIKPGVPVFTAATDAALQVISDTARANDCPLYIYDKDFWMVREYSDEGGQRAFFRGRDSFLQDVYGIQMRMHGSHQLKNAGLAIAAFEWCIQHVFKRIGFAGGEYDHTQPYHKPADGVKPNPDSQVVRNTIRVGVRMMHWAGRFEVIQRHPLWILDGAHNPHGTKALADTLHEWQIRNPRRLLLLMGVLRDKDLSTMLNHILPFATAVIATAPDTPRALPAAVLAQHVQSNWCGQVRQAPTVPEAIELANDMISDHELQLDGVICIGSLYTISEARNYILNTLQKKRFMQ